MADESFLPETTLTPFYYRGSHNQIVPNYPSNTGARPIPGFDGMGSVTIGSGTTNKMLAFGGVLVGAAIMYFGYGRAMSAKGGKAKAMALPIMGLGAGVAYFAGVRQLSS